MAKKKNGTPGGKSKRKRSLSTEDEELPPPPAEESPMQEEDDDSGAASASASASEEEGEGEGGEVLSEESGDDGDDGEVPSAPAPATRSFKSDGRYHNKQRCLTLCSRGVTARYRHLLEDLRTLIPHAKKESKLDPGKAGSDLGGGTAKSINDIAEMRSCSTVLFLECRKRMDAYLWVGRAGPSASGPSVKFEVSNVHTMDELRLTGNCMKGSRPFLTFDESFDRIDELRVIKALFVDVFGCPRGHPKSKPFVDRVMGFYYADGKVCSLIMLRGIWPYMFLYSVFMHINNCVFLTHAKCQFITTYHRLWQIWVRNYQILEEAPTNAKEAREERRSTGSDRATNLVEIGPRFVLNPIRIFRGSFGGQTLYQNSEYVNPNVVRAQMRREKGRAYEVRKGAERMRKKRKEELVVPADPLANVFS